MSYINTFSVRHLRDVPEYPNCLRPLCVESDGDVRSLVTEMISQVVQCHQGLRYIHLGCDEVWSLGETS